MDEVLSPGASYLCSLVIILTILVFTLRVQGKTKDVSYLFVVMNGVALFSFFLQQSSLLNLPSLSFFISVFLSLIAFPLGYQMINRGTSAAVSYRSRVESLRYKLHAGRMLFANRCGYFFYLAGYLYELSQAGGIFPLLAADKLQAYYTFPINFVHYLVVASIPISIIYAYLTFFRNKGFWFDHVFVFIIIVLNTLILARSIVMTQVFIIVYIWFLHRRYALKLSTVTSISLLLLSFITIIGYYRTGDSLRVILDIGGLSHWSELATPFAWPYLYFSTAVENFRDVYMNTVIDDLQTVTLGARYIFTYVLTLLQLKDYIPNSEPIDFSAGGFNTFGLYLSAFYDFYIFFPLFFLILGSFVAFFERNRRPSFCLFFPYIVYCVFTSPVNDYFGQFFTLVYWVYIWLVVVFAHKKRLSR